MSKKQIGINILANIISFSVSTGINFFFTPFLIKSVGIEAYSFLPMTGNITSYFTIISTALNSMAARFITIEIQKNNKQKANTYFTTVLYSNIALSVLFSLILAGIVCFLELILQIPESIVFDIKTLFALTFFSTIVTLLTSVYSVATFCKNRLDLNSIVQIMTSLLRIAVLILLFAIFRPNIIYLGIASIIVALAIGIMNIIFTKKLLPDIIVKKKYFDKKAIAILLGSGIWNSIAQSGSILLTGFDLVLANMFLNATSAGNIAVSKTIPNLIYSISALVVTAFVPEFTILYAKGKNNDLVNSLKYSLKILSLFLSVPLAGILVFGKEFYKLWIPGQDINLIYILTILTMIPTFFSVFVAPLRQIYPVTNNLKKPTIFTLILGLCNIIIVILSLKLAPKYGVYAIAGVSGLLILSDVLVFLPVYSAMCLNLKRMTFFPHILRSTLSTIILIGLFFVEKKLFVIDSWFMLMLAAAVCGTTGLILNYLLLLKKNERQMINLKIKSVINRR